VTPTTFYIDSDDPDHAAELSGTLASFRFVAIETSSPFRFRLEASVSDALSVGKVVIAAPLSLQAEELDSYNVVVPIFGRLSSQWSSKTVLIAPGSASIFRPGEHTGLISLDSDAAFWGLRFEAKTLERHLAALVKTTDSPLIDFAPEVDLTSPHGQSWWALTEPLRNPAILQVLSTLPMVLQPYLETLAVSLLFAAEHPLSANLRLAVPGAKRSYVAIAVDQVRAAPDQSWTVSMMAESSFCSVRALQAGFRRDLGTTPMQFLADTRMERVHRELVHGEAPHVTVSAVAARWGFIHLGRFSLAYKRRYGESPSQTLRRAH
jgi:AraC-like DNA-binding protein